MSGEVIGVYQVLRCSNPTCGARVSIGPSQPRGFLCRIGWRMERQPGDDREMPYCGRCKL